MGECDRCSVNDVCDECSEGFYWWASEGRCEAFVECGAETYTQWTEDLQQVCLECSGAMSDCLKCSNSTVCDECHHEFYWWSSEGKCEMF